MFPISEGSKFHNLSAAIVNDLSPVVAADFFYGGINNIALLDRVEVESGCPGLTRLVWPFQKSRQKLSLRKFQFVKCAGSIAETQQNVC